MPIAARRGSASPATRDRRPPAHRGRFAAWASRSAVPDRIAGAAATGTLRRSSAVVDLSPAVIADAIVSSSDAADLLRDGSRLHMASHRVGSRMIDVFYAPFEHVEREARVVIVGLTPGRHQALVALETYREALGSNMDPAEALRTAKVAASFSGPMRANLVRMLDAVGLAGALDLSTTAEFWSTASTMVHFTSLV